MFSNVSAVEATETTTPSVSTTGEMSTTLGKSSDWKVSDNSMTVETSKDTNDEGSNVKDKKTNSNTQVVDESFVGSWTDFVSAVRDEGVKKIILTGSFDNTKGSDPDLYLYKRKNDLEIDGKGYRVNFKNSSIWLGTPANSIGTFYMHDIILDQDYAGAYSDDIVGNRGISSDGAKWKYRFGNIKTDPGVMRIARASYSEVRVYGKMDINTRAENFYPGSFIMEDGTEYKGNVNFYDFSVFFYNTPTISGSTGESREFTIGKNCKVDIGQTQKAGGNYPAVYSNYQAITVGENSICNIDMPGNAVRFNTNGAGMTIKKGAVVNLTSKRSSYSVVAFSANNTYLNAEPGSYFYVIGNSTQPLINLASTMSGNDSITRTGNKFILNSPAQYDLRNLNDNRFAVKVAYGQEGNNSFSILDSDIDLWKVGVPVLGPSSEAYAKVPSLKVEGSGLGEVVTTSVPGLKSFKQSSYRRLSGINQNPKIEWTPVTDADKRIQGRVIVGEVPDNNGLVGGEIKYIPVYASENQAQVTFTDTHGNIRANLSTDADGYISYTDTNDPIQFQKAGGKISGIAKRGPWVTPDPIETAVIDVTPPEPAKVDNKENIQTITSKLTGSGEPDSIVTLMINDKPPDIPSRLVGKDGTWEVDISSFNLAVGDIIQVFLQDQSGSITELSPSEKPDTNDSVGNINPKKDMNYRDTTFKAATKINIIGILSIVTVPDALEFGNNQVSNKNEIYRPSVSGDLVISDTRGNGKKPWRLALSQSEVLKNGEISLDDALYYTSQLGEKKITTAAQIVESGEFTSDGAKNISEGWHGNNGFKLDVPVEKQRVGDYSGKLSWKLEDVPGN